MLFQDGNGWDWDGNQTSYKSNLPWADGEPNGELRNENCVLSNVQHLSFLDMSCSEKYCFPCQFNVDVFFDIRGLCEEQVFMKFIYNLFIFVQFLKCN